MTYEDEILNERVQADPKRPYKLYATILSTMLSTFVTSELELDPWVRVLVSCIVAGLAVYLTPNRVTLKKGAPGFTAEDSQGQLF